MEVDQTNQDETSTSSLLLQRKKHRGNRNNQRFRRKCRALFMKSTKIEKLLKKRNLRRQKLLDKSRNQSVPPLVAQPMVIKASNQPSTGTGSFPVLITTTAMTTTKRTKTGCKRKRDMSILDFRSHPSIIPRSASSMSIMTTAAPSPPKRIKRKKKSKELCSINPMIQMHYRYVLR